MSSVYSPKIKLFVIRKGHPPLRFRRYFVGEMGRRVRNQRLPLLNSRAISLVRKKDIQESTTSVSSILSKINTLSGISRRQIALEARRVREVK